MVHTMFDSSCHREMVSRLRRLRPDAQRLWGRMTAPQMVAHLRDQMRHCLGLAECAPQPGLFRTTIARKLVIYWLPWPRGRVKGPPEAFVTKPGEWKADLADLELLLQQFIARGPAGTWPEHARLGPMTGKDWGVFCHKHFNHHLRQFGV